MAKILNKMNQRLLINLKSGRNIDLLARGTADVPEDDLMSSHLRTLAEKGYIIVSRQQTVETRKVRGATGYAAKEGKSGKKEGRK